MKGQVQVYRNLHKTLEDGTKVFSVKNDKGIVEDHVTEIAISRPILRVGPKGNQRVRDEGRKNVHAYIQGRECYNAEEERWEYIGPDCNYVNDPNTVTVAYNPYKNDTFIRKDTGESLTKAKVVIFGCGEMSKEVKAIL